MHDHRHVVLRHADRVRPPLGTRLLGAVSFSYCSSAAEEFGEEGMGSWVALGVASIVTVGCIVFIVRIATHPHLTLRPRHLLGVIGALLVAGIVARIDLLFVLAWSAPALAFLGAIDAALKPDSAWRAADQNKLIWVLLQGAGALALGLGALATLAYIALVRPHLLPVKDRAQGEMELD